MPDAPKSSIGDIAGGAGGELLISRLRASVGEPATDLSGLPRMIASALRAEVCSIYLVGRSGLLELVATDGLDPGAVGVTRFKPGEGIVGQVAQTGIAINLGDAQTHPAFAFRLETDEGHLSAMLAYPIAQAGIVLGVLTLQGSRRQPFSADDFDSVARAAVLIAAIVDDRRRLSQADPGFGASRAFRGVQLAPGVVSGRLKFASGYRRPVVVVASDPAAESARLERAVQRMNRDLDLLLAGHESTAHGPDGAAARDVLEATRVLSGASGWLRRVRDAMQGGLSAEAAVQRVTGELRARMSEVADPLLREKLADFEDTAFGLLVALDEERSDRPGAPDLEPLAAGTILVVRRLGPAKLLHLQARGVAGLVIEEASPAGHAAILARSVGIPAIGAVRGVLALLQDGPTTGDGAEAILDADDGRLLLRPEPAVARFYAAALDRRAAERSSWAAIREMPDRTRDGTAFSLRLNVGLAIEMAQLDATGAAGIGLFRTEIHALARGAMPTEAEQEAFYRAAFQAACDRPIVFRTLDLGADKLLPGQPATDEENPAMGWRSIRVGLDNPPLLRSQLRAILRAADGRPVSIMFPMIATLGEFARARAMLDDAMGAIAVRPVSCAVGVMLEVPSLLFCLPALFAAADFVSIGSNDLFQFLFAADRGTARIASRYDLFAAPALAMIDTIVAEAASAGASLSLCGEIAGRPLEALTLAALGVTTLSMSPAGLPRVKSLLVATDLGAVRQCLAQLRLDGLSGDELRRALTQTLSDWGTKL